MADKPDCYKCKHRQDLPGSCHSRCTHPVNGNGDADPFSEIMAVFASVCRVPQVIGDTAAELDIKGNKHGIRNGWFNWPFNFDPVWLESCNGFDAKHKQAKTTT